MGFSLTELEVKEVSVCVCTHQSRFDPLFSSQMCPLEFEGMGDVGPCYPSDLIHRLLLLHFYSTLLAKHTSVIPFCCSLCLESSGADSRISLNLSGSPCLGPLIREAFSNPSCVGGTLFTACLLRARQEAGAEVGEMYI